jgi:hypothetical protein
VKRIAQSFIYLCVGIMLPWQSALWMNRASHRFSWPLVGTRWHDCWDTEHCHVSVFGYTAIFAFIAAPSLVWAIVGFKTETGAASRIASAALLTLGTMFFYAMFYIAVWP